MASSSSPYEITAHALRVGEIFSRYCTAQLTRGTVHSVFDHAVNLQMEDDGLITVVTIDKGGASRFLVVSESNLSRFPLMIGQECLLSPREAKIGPLCVALKDARIWRGPLAKDTRGIAGRQTAERFKAALDRLRPEAGNHTGSEPALLEMLGDRSRAADAVHGLIGLGPGLTPAGDDMTLGFLAVQSHLGEDEELTGIIREAVRENLSRTTDISAQMLDDAVCGEYHEYVQAVVAALCDNAADSLGILLPRLLSVGASSGSDIATGMAAALARLAE